VPDGRTRPIAVGYTFLLNGDKSPGRPTWFGTRRTLIHSHSMNFYAFAMSNSSGGSGRGFATIYRATTLHPFNGLFSRTIWVCGYQKGKTSLDLNDARDDGVWPLGMQWHQLDHIQSICTSLHTDNHTNTRSLRLSNTNLLSAPFVRTSFGSRSFSAAAHKIWNSLPLSPYLYQS